MRPSLLFLLIAFTCSLSAQKKMLDHADFDIWNTIENETLSPDGAHVMYSLEKGEADQYLRILRSDGSPVFAHERAGDGRFTYDSEYALFSIRAWKDSVLEMKRRKVKKEDLPLDTLGIYRFSDGHLEKIPRVRSFKVPEKWAGFIAYQPEPEPKGKEEASDSTENGKPVEEEKPKKKRKPGKKNGYDLVVRELATGRQDTFRFVTEYHFAKNGKRLAFVSTGTDQEPQAGIHVVDLETGRLKTVHQGRKARYYAVGLSESGAHLGFVTDEDTTKVQIRPTRLYHWKDGMEEAALISGPPDKGDGLSPSRYEALRFSRDETRMYYGLAKPPVLRDTSLLDEEIVNVEVWTYDEPRLYTVQEMQVKNDTVSAFKAVYHLPSGKHVQLAGEAYPDMELTEDGNAPYGLLSNSGPYELEQQWTGIRARDYAVVDMKDGSTRAILTGVAGPVELSPEGKYAYGYHTQDSTWFAYNIREGSHTELNGEQAFYNELHDTPSAPWPYGLAGWTEKDDAVILYDRYDLWKFDPDSGASERLTRGRESGTVYRYVQLDEEQQYLDPRDAWLLTTFREADKSSGYASFDPRRNTTRELVSGPYRYGRPQKAALADKLMFTRESFREFPDLWVSGMDVKDPVRVSRANPQQEEYLWGDIELVKWTSLDGKELTGMLVKPENFDPDGQYPMIVNFYEKSSDDLHRHRTPSPGRSTINYAFYASRGYLIFNPDVHYRTGYPGESAYNCVIPGITALVEQGFVDRDNIGVQGHSWGGYQIAHLVTKTDIFKAAEAGAPVPNMISAYGGIRWWTGLSRQFQYEHTQSRIGGTPWEYPMRYLENSPIFNIDKINTPLLIMHNDADGHVPWYQGIEFFVSLRRLGKPSWFLNYNGEPHWPLKLQNRKDFNIRMAQFFDHYLKGAPMPVWMERGVPAVEKGINQGYELLGSDKGE